MLRRRGRYLVQPNRLGLERKTPIGTVVCQKFHDEREHLVGARVDIRRQRSQVCIAMFLRARLEHLSGNLYSA